MESKTRLVFEAKELLILSNLFFSKNYPYGYVSLEDVGKIIGCSKASAIGILKGLENKGVVVKVKGFVNFYYPVRDREIKQILLEKLGIK